MYLTHFIIFNFELWKTLWCWHKMFICVYLLVKCYRVKRPSCTPVKKQTGTRGSIQNPSTVISHVLPCLHFEWLLPTRYIDLCGSLLIQSKNKTKNKSSCFCFWCPLRWPFSSPCWRVSLFSLSSSALIFFFHYFSLLLLSCNTPLQCIASSVSVSCD